MNILDPAVLQARLKQQLAGSSPDDDTNLAGTQGEPGVPGAKQPAGVGVPGAAGPVGVGTPLGATMNTASPLQAQANFLSTPLTPGAQQPQMPPVPTLPAGAYGDPGQAGIPGFPGAKAAASPKILQTGAAQAPVDYGQAPNPLATPGAPTPLNQAVAQALVQSGMGAQAARPTLTPPSTRTVVSSGPGGLQTTTLPMGQEDIANWMRQQTDNQAIAGGKLPSQDRYLNDATKGTMSPLEQAMKLQPGSELGDKLRGTYDANLKQQQALGLENDKLGVERLKVGADLAGRQLVTDAEKDRGLDAMITASVNAGDKPEVTQAKVDMYRAAKQYSTDDKKGLAGVGLVSPPINVGVANPKKSPDAAPPSVRTDPKELAKKASDVIENTASQAQMDAVLKAAFPASSVDQQGRTVTSGALNEEGLIKAVADAKNVRGASGVKDLMTKVFNSPGSGVGTPYDFRSRLQKRLLGLHQDLNPQGSGPSTYGGITVSPAPGGYTIGPQGSQAGAYEPHGLFGFGDVLPTMRDSSVNAKKAEAEAIGAILGQGIGY